MKRGFAAGLSTLLAVIGLSACGGPEREIRAGLTPAERARFDRGQQLSTPCWSCHDLYGQQNKVGPYLAGVYGRRAGSAQFPGYSDALKASGVVWDDRSLRAFLMNPSSYIPGTNMVEAGVRGAGDADALAFYLKLVSRAVAKRQDTH